MAAETILNLGVAGLGASQQSVLTLLKLQGATTIPQLAAGLDRNIETIRHHLESLILSGLVERQGTRRGGRGRPEVVYGLTPAAEQVFPRREGEILQQLALFLKATDNDALLSAFFDQYIGERRETAMSRVEGLDGTARVDEAAVILTELGFMAVSEVVGDLPQLRLCHCPLRALVEATAVPCRAEIGFVRDLLGEEMTRVSYIPSGDRSCCYRVGAA